MKNPLAKWPRSLAALALLTMLAACGDATHYSTSTDAAREKLVRTTIPDIAFGSSAHSGRGEATADGVQWGVEMGSADGLEGNGDTVMLLMVDAATGSEVGRAQLSLLKCFHDLVRVGRFKPCLHLRTIESRRLQTVLRAFDGASAGASHREIATVLYGPARIVTDWDDPRENLKDHIRKTIRRGFDIVHGGYRSFLR